MAEIDLNFIGKQLQRVLSELSVIRGSLELAHQAIARSDDSIGIVQSDVQGLRADIAAVRADLHADIVAARNDLTSTRNEITATRHAVRSGFDLLDARLRPLEDAAD